MYRSLLIGMVIVITLYATPSVRAGTWAHSTNTGLDDNSINLEILSARHADGVLAVTWRTSTEIDTVGFHIYCAASTAVSSASQVTG